MDDEDRAFEEMLEAELMAEMDGPAPALAAPAPPPAAEPKQQFKRPSKRLKRSGDSSSEPAGSHQIETLAAVASATRQSSSEAGASTTRGESAEDNGDDDAPGYMWGMNIITGKSREEEEAEAKANAQAKAQDDAPSEDPTERKRPRSKLVQLRYGSYQGMQLSVAEVRRIKAEECRALLARRKLVRARPSTFRTPM